MVSVVQFLPLLAAVGLLTLLALSPAVRPLDRGLSRVAWVLFEGRR
ncbi:hypothetical protein [Halosegnis marinus]